MDFQKNPPERIGIKRNQTNDGFVLKEKTNIFLFQQQFQHGIFVMIGESGNAHKIVHALKLREYSGRRKEERWKSKTIW